MIEIIAKVKAKNEPIAVTSHLWEEIEYICLKGGNRFYTRHVNTSGEIFYGFVTLNCLFRQIGVCVDDLMYCSKHYRKPLEEALADGCKLYCSDDLDELLEWE